MSKNIAIMLSAIMLSAIMLSAIMVSVVRLNIKVLVERGRLVGSTASIFVFCDWALTSLYLDCMFQG